MAQVTDVPFGDFVASTERLTDFVLDPVTGDFFTAAETGQIFRLDPGGNIVAEIANVGGTVRGFDITSDGQTLIVAQQVTSGSESTLHRIDIASGTVTDATFAQSFAEQGSFDVAAMQGGNALFTTTFGGSGWTPIRAFDVQNLSFTQVFGPDGPGGQVRGGSLVTPSGDDRYVFLQEVNISSAPMSIYDSATGGFIAATDNFETPGGSFNQGGADITSAGFVYNRTYGAKIFDFSFQVVQDFSSPGYLSIAFSNDGSLLYALTPDSRIDIVETAGWSTVQTLILEDFVGPEAADFTRIHANSTDDTLILERVSGFFGFDATRPQAFLLDLDAARDAYLTGTEDDDVLTGTSGSNIITGLAGNDTLNGRAGADRLTGGLGNDRYFVDDPGDMVIELEGEGIDTVTTSIDFVLPDHVERASSSGSFDLDISGNALANFITGNVGANSLSGLAGADRLRGGAGNDTLDGGAGDDVLEGQAGDDVFVLGVNAGRDTVYDFELGADLLDFSTLGLRLVDLAVLYSAGSTRIEYNGGTEVASINLQGISPDQITSAIMTDATGLGSAGGGVRLIEGDVADNNLVGGATAEDLVGGAGNDTLNARGGNDTMVGGLGDDQYFVEQAGDVVIEHAGQGYDLVRSAFSFMLPDNVEAGTARNDHVVIDITGNELNNNIYGNSQENALFGGDGRDRLQGRAGNDTVDGGTDNDVLEGGSGADRFVFNPGAGMDIILDYEVGIDVIDVTGMGLGYADLTIVDGHMGARVLFDLTPGSVQLVTLNGVRAEDLTPDDFLTLVLGTPENDVLVGSEISEELRGLAGNDLILGAAGSDTMLGGPGDDWYFVDDAGDIVFEQPDEGIDRVTTAVSLVLPEYVEQADTQSAEAINLTGNASENDLTGNDSENVLMGVDGSDTLRGGGGADLIDGGSGADLLIGGSGSDRFVFRTGDGFDRIVDFLVGEDVLDLSATGLNAGDLERLDVGPNVLFHYGSDSILLLNADTAHLTPESFDFGP